MYFILFFACTILNRRSILNQPIARIVTHLSMSRTPHITVPHQDTDGSSFKPRTALPEQLARYQELSADLREKMDPIMKRILSLTDKTALRSAALPQHE